MYPLLYMILDIYMIQQFFIYQALTTLVLLLSLHESTAKTSPSSSLVISTYSFNCISLSYQGSKEHRKLQRVLNRSNKIESYIDTTRQTHTAYTNRVIKTRYCHLFRCDYTNTVLIESAERGRFVFVYL